MSQPVSACDHQGAAALLLLPQQTPVIADAEGDTPGGSQSVRVWQNGAG